MPILTLSFRWMVVVSSTKQTKLRLLDTHIVEFQQFALRRHEMFRSESGGSMSGYERLLSKDNISVFALLEFVDPKDEKSGIFFCFVLKRGGKSGRKNKRDEL